MFFVKSNFNDQIFCVLEQKININEQKQSEVFILYDQIHS